LNEFAYDAELAGLDYNVTSQLEVRGRDTVGPLAA
jgi:hypothetical protein